MIEPRPLRLSDRQMQLVRRAAAAMPQGSRHGFLQAIGKMLAGEPSDAALVAAINSAMDRTSLFVCDSAAEGKRQCNK
jgi:hypothetical protein